MFLSYGHADAGHLAVRLERDLTASGFDVWMDRSKMRPGRSWEEQIEREILSCDVVLSLLSPHAVRRPDGVCLDEISFARYNGRRVVPIMVKPCQPPLGIYRLDWIDFLSWEDKGRYPQRLRRVVEAIASDRDRVDGEHARLLAALRPLDVGIEVSRLTRGFTRREWLFTQIDDWLANDDSRMFLITGDPGTGKSAVMARLAAQNPAVTACHFCVSSLSDSLDPFRFACSIAAQLATQIDDYRMALDAVDLERIQAIDASTVWRRVIVDPLTAVGVKEPMLIVVDALDESARVEGRSIPSLLRDQAEAMPPGVRFVVSTRSEPEILDSFSLFPPHEIATSSAANQLDIATYIDRRLRAPRLGALISGGDVDAGTLAAAIAARGDGNFLYVTHAMAALEAGHLDPRHPEQFPNGLVGVYQSFFERIFPSAASFRTFRPVLEVLCAAREPLWPDQVAGFLQQDRLDVQTDLERVAAFFPESEGRYRPYHKSIVDWLGGEAGHSLRFRVDIRRGHRLIGDSLLRRYQDGDRSAFTLAHLPAHLHEAGNDDDMNALLATPTFVLAKAAAGMFQAAIGDYERSSSAELHIVRDALILSAHVAASDPAQLAAQLSGRLRGFAETALADFVRGIEPGRDAMLLPRTASLAAPGGPLMRTILGSSGVVRDVEFGTVRGRSVIVSCDWGKEKPVRLWDPQTGDPIGDPMTGHSEVPNGVSFGRLADGKAVIASCGNDGTSRLWDAESRRPLGIVSARRPGADHSVKFVEFKGAPAILVASAYGTILVDPVLRAPCTPHTYGRIPAIYTTLENGTPVIVSNGDDDVLRVWDVETGRVLSEPRTGHRLQVSALAAGVLPDGRRVIASGSFDATVRLWRLDSGEPIMVWRGHAAQYDDEYTTLYLARAISDLAFGECVGVPCLASTSGDGTLRIWNLHTFREFGTPLVGHTYGVNAVAWGRLGDTDVIVSGGEDHSVRIWRPVKGVRTTTRARGHEAAVIAMAAARVFDRSVIATGSEDGSLMLWNAESGEQVGAALEGHGGAVRTLAIGETAEGVPMLASGGSDGMIRLLNLRTLQPLHRPIDTGGDEVWSVRTTTIGRRTVIAATVDYRNPFVRFWSLETTRSSPDLNTGHQDSVPAIAYGVLHGSAVLVTAGQDDTLCVWHAETLRPIGPRLGGHTGWSPMWQTLAFADSIAFGELDDGTPVIICPNVDHTIRVLAVDSGQEVLAPLAVHDRLIFSVRYGRVNGRAMCVSAGDDRRVQLWHLSSGRPVADFITDAPVLCCAIDVEGRIVAAGDQSGAVHLLSIVKDGQASA